MEDKLKKLLQIMGLLEEVVIRIISIIGWILILIDVVKG